MIKLYNPWKAFLRFRTSRGFGIHSPFAYYFVLRVLREKYPYYAFADICRFAKISKQSPKEACLIFRIVNFYNPDVIYTFGCDDVVTLKAMLMVNSELTMASIPIPKVESYDNRITRFEDFAPDNRQIVVIDKADIVPDVDKLLSVKGIIIIRKVINNKANNELWLSLKQKMSFGHTYTNDKVAVIVPSPKLPLQHFSLYF